MSMEITSNAGGVAARLLAMVPLLQASFFDTMGRSLDAMEQEAVSYMFATFKNAQGPLEGAFYQTIEMTGEGVTGRLANASAYSWRRDKGFVGMFDSLGRGPFHDEGIEYMEHALGAETATTFSLFTDAIGQVLGGV